MTPIDSSSRGRLVVLDGPSSAGKSTITSLLFQEEGLGLEFVKRYTTRDPRPGDDVEGNYIFVNHEQFQTMEDRGEFIEVRHFQFGMSYGLRFADIDDVLDQGKNALAIISLGNVDLIREHYTDAIGVFVTAPLADIEARLRARGADENKVQERLENASKATQFEHRYDYVVVNKEGKLTEVIEELIKYLHRELDGQGTV